jgi:hypothetical protein
MSALQIVQVLINDQSNRTITGIIQYDRNLGGTLIIPSGSSLPLSGVAGEIIWNTSDDTIYRRDDSNTIWEPVNGGGGSSSIASASYVLVNPTGSLPFARTLSGSTGVVITDLGAGNGILVSLLSPFTSASHGDTRQLIHFIDDGPASGMLASAYKETLPFNSPFPTSEIWWTSPAKTLKLLQHEITRSVIQLPVTESWKMFDSNGSQVEGVLDVITYSGVFETSRTRTIT